MQRLVNIGKPYALFFNKTIFYYKNYVFQPLCTRGPPTTQFANLNIEKNLVYLFTSNKMLVCSKSSNKYANKHSISKHVLNMSHDVVLMLSFI